MAGYNGFSKSNNAVEAENNGRFPLTKIRQLTGLTSDFIREVDTDEYHHTSKFYNVTNYYDLDRVVEAAIDRGITTPKIRAILAAERENKEARWKAAIRRAVVPGAMWPAVLLQRTNEAASQRRYAEALKIWRRGSFPNGKVRAEARPKMADFRQ